MKIFLVLLIAIQAIGRLMAQPVEGELDYSVILIGDAGEHKRYMQAVMDKASQRLDQFGQESAVVFLGDNIYPLGLPVETDSKREEMEGKLKPQLDVIVNSATKGFIVPGNHDWAKGKRQGRTNILEQQQFIANYLGQDQAYNPKNACPGPVEVSLFEDLSLVMIDTEWLLHEETNLSKSQHCEYKNNAEVMAAIADIVDNNMDKNLLFVAHHPVLTYGSHGGVFHIKQHIFPLTDMKKGLLIPLPVIGSFYPAYRKWFGNIQDATNKRYKAIMAEMVTSFEKHPRTIHAAGHEHALQHMTRNNVEYIVSGSGAKTEFVKKKGFANYVTGYSGLTQLYYYANGDIWMEFWVFNEDSPEGAVAYKAQLFDQKEIQSND